MWDHAFASGDEDEAGFGFEAAASTPAEIERRENFYRVGIEHDLAFAGCGRRLKRPVMLDVDARAVGVPAGARDQRDLIFSVLGIDGDQFGFVFDVDEDGAFAIGDGEFWAAAEVYWCRRRCRSWRQ